MTYADRQLERIRTTGSNLCIGLDPRPELIRGNVEGFLSRVMEETLPYAAAYKPNIAYFEAMGSEGIGMLERLLSNRPDGVPIVLDAKRSDIGETQKYYAKACFERWNVDAVTLNPFLGYDTIEPFLAYPGKGVFLLALTSNPGASEIQRQRIGEKYVFELVQDMALRAPRGSAGLVVGLTNTDSEVLARVADLPLLIPGLGAQGGDLHGLSSQKRTAPLLINVSRGVLYGDERESFAERARQYRDQISATL